MNNRTVEIIVRNFKAVSSLCFMVKEMIVKDLDLHRITKVVSLLTKAGVSINSFPVKLIEEKVLMHQNSDGGWIAIVDSIWNLYFLKILRKNKTVERGLTFLERNRSSEGLWGRYVKDRNRIPVSGIIFHLFPEIITNNDVNIFKKLWEREFGSLTYKAAYFLIASKSVEYYDSLVDKTVSWLINQQREDGSYGPWKEHPVPSNVLYTSLAIYGLSLWGELVPRETLENGIKWILDNQIATGIWPYHEIEEGASWAVLAINSYLSNQAEHEE